jgi:hypothetical protein
MATEYRVELRRMVDALPEGELRPAYEALAALLAAARGAVGEDAQARVDRRLLETGRLDKMPIRDYLRDNPRTPRPSIAGGPVAQTIIDERG